MAGFLNRFFPYVRRSKIMCLLYSAGFLHVSAIGHPIVRLRNCRIVLIGLEFCCECPDRG